MKRTVGILVVFVCGLAAAQEEAKKPPAELEDAMQPFVGNWRCAGRVFASQFGPEHVTEGTVAVKADLDGFWYSMRSEEKKTKASPNPEKAVQMVGWDPAQKKIIGHAFASNGLGATMTSTGWQGDKLVWNGELNAMGQKISFRSTFTRKGDNQMSGLEEVSMKKGEWTKISESVCKK